jgi:hypothetical protein
MKTLSAKAKICGLTLVEALALILLADFNRAAAQGLTFTTNTFYVGGAQTRVVAADVNGDGRLDLISANANMVMEFTNNGSGGFTYSSQNYLGSSTYIESILAADIDGDGKPDLICGNLSGTLTILTNNSSGGFGSNATIKVVQNFLSCITAADVNSDGKLDLVCANNNIQGGSPALTIWTNNGSGGFGSNATLTVGNQPQFVAAADVNGDGYVDLISANYAANTLTVLTNNGSGVFGSNATLNVGHGPWCVAAADINGDGKVDLISANEAANTLTVLTNNGGGIFGSNATLTVGNQPQCVVAADVNGDGHLDLISANAGSTTLTVLTNNGSGSFGFNATLALLTPGAYPIGVQPNYLTAADVNADGRLDLVIANSGRYLMVLINTSTFPPPTFTPSLAINQQSNFLNVVWPSLSPGWSLQENPDLTKTNWLPSGYGGYSIADDGTNKSLNLPRPIANRFFRLLHP